MFPGLEQCSAAWNTLRSRKTRFGLLEQCSKRPDNDPGGQALFKAGKRCLSWIQGVKSWLKARVAFPCNTACAEGREGAGRWVGGHALPIWRPGGGLTSTIPPPPGLQATHSAVVTAPAPRGTLQISVVELGTIQILCQLVGHLLLVLYHELLLCLFMHTPSAAVPTIRPGQRP